VEERETDLHFVVFVKGGHLDGWVGEWFFPFFLFRRLLAGLPEAGIDSVEQKEQVTMSMLTSVLVLHIRRSLGRAM
jgi:hypothetical protein